MIAASSVTGGASPCMPQLRESRGCLFRCCREFSYHIRTRSASWFAFSKRPVSPSPRRGSLRATIWRPPAHAL